MTKKLVWLLLGLSIGCAQAQIKETDLSRQQETQTKLQELNSRQEAAPTVMAKETAQEAVQVGDAELKNNVAMANVVLNTAILRQDWKTVEHILSFYRQIPGYDPILYRFANGKLLQRQFNYRQAIAEYQEILQQQPQLSYVRLELAKMQLENRQYKDARQNLTQVLQQPIVAAAAAEAKHFLQLTKARAAPKFNLSFGLNASNNANRASTNKYFYYYINCPPKIDGEICAVLIDKRPEDLPQKDVGLNSAFSYNQNILLGGNNSLFVGAQVGGERYLIKEHNGLQYAGGQFGYRRENYISTFTAATELTRVWDAGIGYSKSAAAKLSYNRLLSPRWRVSVGYEVSKKNFDDNRNSGYENIGHSVNLATEYYLKRAVLFSGINLRRENARSDEQSLKGAEIFVGAAYVTPNKTNFMLSARKSFKHFKAPYKSFLYDYRRDYGTQLSLSVSNNKLRFAGFKPELFVSYSKTNSTIYIMETQETKVGLTFSKDF